MREPPRLGDGLAVLVVAAVLSVSPFRAAAQTDTTRADSVRADSVRRDSLAADSGRAFVPVMPSPIASGPLGWGARHVFDVDSLRFSGILTLADLLSRLPGVFVARGGFYGQGEYLFYAGRGAASLDVYWDGVPLRPLGRDSVFLDVARIALAPLERIDVQRLPDRLRVDLVTLRVPDTEPRTTIGIMTGDLDIQHYRAVFARRFRNGVGVYVGGNFGSIQGDAQTSTGFHGDDLWFKLEYLPRASLGASYQLLRSSWRRNARANLVDAVTMARQDGSLRVFLGANDDAVGWRLLGTVTSSQITGDSVTGTDGVTRGSLALSRRWSRSTISVEGRLANDVIPGEVEARLGWLPVPFLDLAAEYRATRYDDHGSGTRASGSAALLLPLGFSVRGSLVSARELSAPRLATDTARRSVSWLGALRYDGRFGTVEVGRTERDAFAPAGFPVGLRSLAFLGPTPRTTELTVHGTLRPLPGLELSAWYADPIEGGGDFQLPRHARYSATFFSRFWRQYRSGVFALRGEIAAESWSRGLGGVAQDTTGATSQAILGGATFLEMHLEIQIVGVTLYWAMRNAAAMRIGYVSGLTYPGIVQFYGARWTFLN